MTPSEARALLSDVLRNMPEFVAGLTDDEAKLRAQAVLDVRARADAGLRRAVWRYPVIGRQLRRRPRR